MPYPIRVLQVFAKMNRGGAETMIMNLYRHIDRTKIQFDFIVHTEEKCDFDNEIISLGGKIYRFPQYKGINHFQYKKKWINFFSENQEYKIVHGHVRSTGSIYLKIAKKFGNKTIVHSHSTSSGRGLKSIIKNILQYPIRYIPDYYFACSRQAGEWLFGKKVCNSNKFFIMNNAIDVNKYAFNEKIRTIKRKELDVDQNFVIGHVGRFEAMKNHIFLIEIFKKFHQQNSNSILLLIGDGDMRRLIEKKVTEYGLNKHVIFTGVRSDVPDLLQAIDVFVFPSLYEGLGISVIEAQATGMYCIVSEKIPSEAYVTRLVKTLSLRKTAELWADEIFNLSECIERKDMSETITNAGYNITTVKNWIENFYKKI